MTDVEQGDPYQGLVAEAVEAHAKRRIKSNWRFVRFYVACLMFFGWFGPFPKPWFINVYALLQYGFYLSLPVVLLRHWYVRQYADRRLELLDGAAIHTIHSKYWHVPS